MNSWRALFVFFAVIVLVRIFFSSEPQIKTEPTSQKTEILRPSSLPTFVPKSFHGNACTDDCSGHEAGYTWAEEHDINDEDDCDGNSDSFIEGCTDFVEERQLMDESSSDGEP